MKWTKKNEKRLIIPTLQNGRKRYKKYEKNTFPPKRIKWRNFGD